MKLLVGLGNKGKKYAETRHNIGFMVIDKLAGDLDILVLKEKFQSLFGIGEIGENEVCFIKPQTFMNLSGEAVHGFVNFYKISGSEILVVHDDMDMQFGKIKFIFSSGSGGHNGVADIIEHLGTKEFFRLKIGVSRPKDDCDPANHVLDSFSKEEKKILKKIVKKSTEGVIEFFTHGHESAMQKYNGFPLV